MTNNPSANRGATIGARHRWSRGHAGSGSPSPWRSLRNRNFRLFWSGALVSNTGRWFESIAVPAVVWELTGSAGWVGFAGFMRMAPMALVSPVAGTLADRFDRRKLIFVIQVFQAAATLALLLTWVAGVRSAGAFVALNAVAGVVGGMNMPAWKAFVNDLVDRELLLNAIALSSMQFNASRMLGPALAGATLAAFGAAWAFFINFVSFGAVLVALALIDVRVAPSPREKFRPFSDFFETVAWIRSHAGISQAIKTVSVVGFLGIPIQVLAVVFAEDVFGSDERAYGLMLTMIGLGAVLTGPLIAGRWSPIPRSRLEAISLGTYACGIAGFALAPGLAVAYLALLFVGAAHLTSASVLNTAVQLQVPEERRAKVLAVLMMAITFSSPVGQLVLGQIMDRIGPRPTMVAAAVAMAAFAGVFISTGRLRSLDADPAADAVLAGHAPTKSATAP